MTYRIILASTAEKDIEEIIEWYGKENNDISRKFIHELEEQLQIIALNPFLFQEVYKNYRKANTGKFPYKIVYRIEDESILVAAIFHNKREPKIWQKRT